MTKLTHDILEKIKKEGIKPRPKWYFILMHVLLWASVIITILLGALAMAITLRYLLHSPWELARMAIPGRIKAFAVMLPYIWLVFVGITVLLASRLFTHTKKGYRIRPVFVVLGSILLSLALGVILYFAKVDQPVEERLRDHLKPYEQWQERKQTHFLAPEKGVISGRIIEFNRGEQAFILMDIKKNEWDVDLENADYPPLLLKKPVVVSGEDLGNFQFEAEVVKFLHPQRGRGGFDEKTKTQPF